MIRYPKDQAKNLHPKPKNSFESKCLKNLEDARGKPGKKWNPSKWFHPNPFTKPERSIVGPDKKIAATEPRGGFVLARVDALKYIPPG